MGAVIPFPFKMGRKRPVAHGPRMKLKRFVQSMKLIAQNYPATSDYTKAAVMALAQMYMNDNIGDCVVAGMGHLAGVFTSNAGVTPLILTDDQILALYSAIGGYVPGEDWTDNGCDETTALNYWAQYGLTGDGNHKIAGSLVVDPTNIDEVKTAIWLFENVFFGIELPDAWLNPAGSGFIWDAGTPNPANGHCVVGVGYNDVGIQISTWGMIGTLTWAALAQNVGAAAGGELHTVVSQDAIIKASGKAPNGFAWDALVADFEAIGGVLQAAA